MSFGLELKELADDRDFAFGNFAHAAIGDAAPFREAAAQSLKKGRAGAEEGPSDAARAELLRAYFLASAAANRGDHVAAGIGDEALAEIETLHAAQVQAWQKQLAPLDATLSCVLRDVSLDEALETIAKATGLSFQVLPGSQADAQQLLSGLSPRITYLDLRGIDAAQALDWLLQPLRLTWRPDSAANSTIQVGSERRFSGHSGWVYDVSLIGMPSAEPLGEGDNGQDVAARLQSEGTAFVEAIRKSLKASDTEVIWYAPGQLLVIGDPQRHARTAQLLTALVDAEGDPAGIPDALHRKTVARAAERLAARDAWTARRELLDVAERHAAYSWALLAAACGGQLDLEALTELQSAWQSDATERLLEGPGVGLVLRSAWAVTRAADLLPDQSELVALSKSVRARSGTAAEHAVRTVQASPGEEAKRLAAIYACLATGDAALSAELLEALAPESAGPATLAARTLLTPGSGESGSALAELVASDQIRGEDSLVLVAIACRQAGGVTWEAFRAASGQLLGRQPLAGDVVVLVSRLSGATSGPDEG